MTQPDPKAPPTGDRRNVFVRWMEGVRSGEIMGGPA